MPKKWTFKPPLGAKVNFSHPLAKGLVGLWLMNEGGGNKVYDLSGNENHGTLTNMDPATDWVGGKDGPAIDFDGSDDYVDMGDVDTLEGLNAMSVCLWVNTNKTNTQRFIDKSNNAWGIQMLGANDGGSGGVRWLFDKAGVGLQIGRTFNPG